MESIAYYSSGYYIFLFFIAATAILVFLYLIRIYVPLIFSGRVGLKHFRKYFTVAEGIIWGLFLLASAFFFIRNNIIFSAMLFMALILLIYWFTRFALRDYIAGLVFKSENRFAPGDVIIVNEVKGEIRKFNYRNIEIENDSGNLILLPYTMLLGIISSPQKVNETVLNYSFEAEVSGAFPFHKAADLIKVHILSLPWSVIRSEPRIQLVKETESGYIMKITLFSFDELYFQPMRKSVEAYITENIQKSK